MGSVPSTFATGYKYAGLGYTTAFDAAVPPLGARHAHEEFEDTPCIDKGFYVLMGNNHYVMQSIREASRKSSRRLSPGCCRRPKGSRPSWSTRAASRSGSTTSRATSTGSIEGRPLSGDTRGRSSARCAGGERTALPHPVHIHCNNLGMPGNWETTLETMKALEGRRGHLTHIQFHSYGGGEGDENTFNSKVVPLAEYVNSHENITVDVGQVLFGETTSMTGDGPLGYFLSKVYGGKWFSGDTEMEAGCGITPIKYKNKSLVHSLQWAIGLEWYLLVEDPWRVVMSTDHPNGGSFLAYPTDHSLSDGPHLSGTTSSRRATRWSANVRRLLILSANTRWAKSPSSPAPAQPGFWGSRTKATSARARTRTSRSTRRMKTKKSCSKCRGWSSKTAE